MPSQYGNPLASGNYRSFIQIRRMMANKKEDLQSQFSRGMIRDLARHMLPQGAVWNAVDFIANLNGVPLRKRGGWVYASPALTSAASIRAMSWSPFSAGAQQVAVDDRGHVFKIDSASTATDKGAAAVPLQNPVFFNDLMIIPSSTVYKYDGSAAPGALGGSPPASDYAATYKSRLMLLKDSKLYFSDALDPTTWDTTNGWMSVTQPGAGIAALQNAILVFSQGQAERIRGAVPPPGGDMVSDGPVFQQGCIDARSIVTYGDKVLWANADGVWISDGAAIDNLMALGGMRQYWQTLLAGWTSTWTIGAGILRGKYIVSVMDGTTFKDALMCDIDTKVWTRLGNVKSIAFASSFSSAPELYMGLRSTNRTAALSTIFTPSSSYASDGDGTAVTPVLETAYFRGRPGSRRWRNFWLTYFLVNGTTLDVSYITTPESSSYTSLGTYAALAAYDSAKLGIDLAYDGLGFKIAQMGASDDTGIFDIEAEVNERESTR